MDTASFITPWLKDLWIVPSFALCHKAGYHRPAHIFTGMCTFVALGFELRNVTADCTIIALVG